MATQHPAGPGRIAAIPKLPIGVCLAGGLVAVAPGLFAPGAAATKWVAVAGLTPLGLAGLILLRFARHALARRTKTGAAAAEPPELPLGGEFWVNCSTDEDSTVDLRPPWRARISKRLSPRQYALVGERGTVEHIWRDSLHATEAEACDAYFAWLDSEVEMYRKACERSAAHLDGWERIRATGSRPPWAAPETAPPGSAGHPPRIGDPSRPRLGDHFWSIAPLADALNEHFGPQPPWLGRLTEHVGAVHHRLSASIFGPPDAVITSTRFYTTFEDARDAYIPTIREELDGYRARLAERAAGRDRWTQARAAGRPRPEPDGPD